MGSIGISRPYPPGALSLSWLLLVCLVFVFPTTTLGQTPASRESYDDDIGYSGCYISNDQEGFSADLGSESRGFWLSASGPDTVLRVGSNVRSNGNYPTDARCRFTATAEKTLNLPDGAVLKFEILGLDLEVPYDTLRLREYIGTTGGPELGPGPTGLRYAFPDFTAVETAYDSTTSDFGITNFETPIVMCASSPYAQIAFSSDFDIEGTGWYGEVSWTTDLSVCDNNVTELVEYISFEPLYDDDFWGDGYWVSLFIMIFLGICLLGLCCFIVKRRVFFQRAYEKGDYSQLTPEERADAIALDADAARAAQEAEKKKAKAKESLEKSLVEKIALFLYDQIVTPLISADRKQGEFVTLDYIWLLFTAFAVIGSFLLVFRAVPRVERLEQITEFPQTHKLIELNTPGFYWQNPDAAEVDGLKLPEELTTGRILRWKHAGVFELWDHPTDANDLPADINYDEDALIEFVEELTRPEDYGDVSGFPGIYGLGHTEKEDADFNEGFMRLQTYWSSPVYRSNRTDGPEADPPWPVGRNAPVSGDERTLDRSRVDPSAVPDFSSFTLTDRSRTRHNLRVHSCWDLPGMNSFSKDILGESYLEELRAEFEPRLNKLVFANESFWTENPWHTTGLSHQKDAIGISPETGTAYHPSVAALYMNELQFSTAFGDFSETILDFPDYQDFSSRELDDEITANDYYDVEGPKLESDPSFFLNEAEKDLYSKFELPRVWQNSWSLRKQVDVRDSMCLGLWHTNTPLASAKETSCENTGLNSFLEAPPRFASDVAVNDPALNQTTELTGRLHVEAWCRISIANCSGLILEAGHDPVPVGCDIPIQSLTEENFWEAYVDNLKAERYRTTINATDPALGPGRKIAPDSVLDRPELAGWKPFFSPWWTLCAGAQACQTVNLAIPTLTTGIVSFVYPSFMAFYILLKTLIFPALLSDSQGRKGSLIAYTLYNPLLPLYAILFGRPFLDYACMLQEKRGNLSVFLLEAVLLTWPTFIIILVDSLPPWPYFPDLYQLESLAIYGDFYLLFIVPILGLKVLYAIRKNYSRAMVGMEETIEGMESEVKELLADGQAVGTNNLIVGGQAVEPGVKLGPNGALINDDDEKLMTASQVMAAQARTHKL